MVYFFPATNCHSWFFIIIVVIVMMCFTRASARPHRVVPGPALDLEARRLRPVPPRRLIGPPRSLHVWRDSPPIVIG